MHFHRSIETFRCQQVVLTFVLVVELLFSFAINHQLRTDRHRRSFGPSERRPLLFVHPRYSRASCQQMVPFQRHHRRRNPAHRTDARRRMLRWNIPCAERQCQVQRRTHPFVERLHTDLSVHSTAEAPSTTVDACRTFISSRSFSSTRFSLPTR